MLINSLSNELEQLPSDKLYDFHEISYPYLKRVIEGLLLQSELYDREYCTIFYFCGEKILWNKITFYGDLTSCAFRAISNYRILHVHTHPRDNQAYLYSYADLNSYSKLETHFSILLNLNNVHTYSDLKNSERFNNELTIMDKSIRYNRSPIDPILDYIRRANILYLQQINSEVISNE